MRLREILHEDYNQDLINDLDNILVSAKAKDINDIDPNVIVRQMQHMGYSIDVGSLITLLQDNPNVQNASPEGIRLTGDDTTDEFSDNPQEDTESQVDQLAQQAAQKGLK